MYYVKHEQECFIRYKTRGDSRLKNDPHYEFISELIIYIKILLDRDWLISVQLIPNSSAIFCNHSTIFCNHSAIFCNHSAIFCNHSAKICSKLI